MTDTSPSDRISRTLQRIATTLRCTVDDLRGDHRSGDPTQTDDLLLLWNKIGSDEGRGIVLAAARRVVRRQNGRAGATP